MTNHTIRENSVERYAPTNCDRFSPTCNSTQTKAVTMAIGQTITTRRTIHTIAIQKHSIPRLAMIEYYLIKIVSLLCGGLRIQLQETGTREIVVERKSALVQSHGHSTSTLIIFVVGLKLSPPTDTLSPNRTPTDLPNLRESKDIFNF